jgi:hypothetical protein
MIETIVKPQPLDNDIAVMKILHLMGQLSLNDIQYILRLTAKIYGKVCEHDVESKAS